jgi:hypothetical protein
MERRGLLAVIATAAAGCQRPDAGDGPEPVVLDHFQGDIFLRETVREIADSAERIVATVGNAGHTAVVELTLFWVPRSDIDPAELTEAELLAAGYERVTETVRRVPRSDTRDVTFERSLPADAAGYYVRWRNLTYGATVVNRGAAGDVVVELVDTTDMDRQSVLAQRTVALAADERRHVAFRTRERFERFRVDTSA